MSKRTFVDYDHIKDVKIFNDVFDIYPIIIDCRKYEKEEDNRIVKYNGLIFNLEKDLHKSLEEQRKTEQNLSKLNKLISLAKDLGLI